MILGVWGVDWGKSRLRSGCRCISPQATGLSIQLLWGFLSRMIEMRAGIRMARGFASRYQCLRRNKRMDQNERMDRATGYRPSRFTRSCLHTRLRLMMELDLMQVQPQGKLSQGSVPKAKISLLGTPNRDLFSFLS